MKQPNLLKLLLLLSLWVVSIEASTGTLTVLVFNDGKPLSGNEVRVDGGRPYMSDGDGSVKMNLPQGNHVVEIFGKDGNGFTLGYFKKPIIVKENRDTEVIASLSKTDGNTIDIDTPVAQTNSAINKVEVATGEGVLKGRVLSSEGDMAVAGARVFVRGTNVDVRTDENGNFTATVPSGQSLSISVVHSAYSAQTVGGVTVPKDGTSSRVIKLTPASMELEEFVVLAPKVEGSITDVIVEEKKINAIANIVGSEEFSKKGDGSAAAALKRVTGVTLIGGKSIFVRGLGERYSNIELNSLPLPSPDPTKRVVPLDIFPSSMIGSMKIQKSGSADIPANFGGGYIDLRTKNQKDSDYVKVSLGVKGNTYTTKDVIGYNGGESDWLGYDDGTRDIPAAILEHSTLTVGERLGIYSAGALGADNYLRMTQEYAARDFTITKDPLPIGNSFSIEYLKNIDMPEDHKLSVYANYSYSAEHSYTEEKFSSYRYDENSVPTALISDGEKRVASSKYSHGFIMNVDYSYADVFNLRYTKLFTHVGEKKTRQTEGVFGSNFIYQYYTYYDWDEKTLDADQLSGEFEYELFNYKNKFEFGLEYATATLNQPNDLLYQDYRRGESEADYTQNFYDGSQNFLGKKIYSEDSVTAAYLTNKTMLDFISDEDTLHLGMAISQKERSSEYQKFFLNKNAGHGVNDYGSLPGGNPEAILDEYVRYQTNINDMPFLVKDLFAPADYFDATVDQSDFFVSYFTKPRKDLEITAGVRYVNLKQTINQFLLDNSNNIMEEEEGLEVNDFFPSLSVKYSYDEKNIIDIAVSRTFIIPDLREFSSGSYFHPYDVATVQGNPELVNTDIYSADLKYSYFFSEDEFMKVGAFYKYLDKPIEDTQENTSSLPIYSYANADFATLYGIEFDFRKNLDFLGEDIEVPYLGSLSKFYLSGNFSLTESDVTLREEQIALLTSNNRQLQGLSQTVYNLTFGYDDDKRSLNLSYNKMGERIRKVGLINEVGVRFGDTYEIPPHTLDFVWIEKLDNGISFKIKIGNILDDETTWTQDGKTINEYKTGQSFSFEATYKF